MPVSLTGRKNIIRLSKKYHNSSCKSSTKLEFIEDVLNLSFILCFLLNSMTPLLMMVFLSDKIESFLPDNGIVSFIIMTTIFSSMLIFGSFLCLIVWLYLDERVKENKYNLDKNDREKYHKTIFF